MERESLKSNKLGAILRGSVVLLGGISAALTASYLLGAVASELQWRDSWTRYFRAHYYQMALLPAASLLLYFLFRLKMGDWLLRLGDERGVKRYTEGRMERSIDRGSFEAGLNSIAFARLCIRHGAYERAAETLDRIRADLEPADAIYWRVARWRCEIFLRQCALDSCWTLLEELNWSEPPWFIDEAVFAVRGEVLAAFGNKRESRRAVDYGKLEKPSIAWKFQVVETLANLHFERNDLDWTNLRKVLKKSVAQIESRVPLQRKELLAIDAYAARKQGRREEAKERLHEASKLEGDKRSERIFEKVEAFFNSEDTDFVLTCQEGNYEY